MGFVKINGIMVFIFCPDLIEYFFKNSDSFSSIFINTPNKEYVEN